MAKWRAQGFTLIEIIISISILTIIMTVGYSSLSGILRTKVLLDDRRESRLIANSVLTRLTRELQLAYSGFPLLPPLKKDETGDEPKRRNSSRINLVGEENYLDDQRPGDSITFLALEGGQYLPDGGTHSGVVQISYKVKEGPEKYDGEKPRTYYLIREELPYIRPLEKAYEKIMIFPITKNLVSLQFRYYDSEEEEWYSSWGEDERVRLPALVKFSLALKSSSGKVSSYTTSVTLRDRNSS